MSGGGEAVDDLRMLAPEIGFLAGIAAEVR